MSDQNEAFAEKVRAAYLEVYGDNPFDEDVVESGVEPFTLGPLVVGIEAQHLDGEHTSIIVYDGSRMAALGLAVRTQHTLEAE